ncbi:hypothetical protein M413DRAFT_449605 [Hebeloma cylindrosporum]|uniref:WH1 domain-containing protein n=1 Tax=Hebeloma cylindrosporum TaxID=76867 RepID=A0A0C3BGD1_HEBCY|nr:hypothetical protein M413DRAFT_449605 [Hebeloma cylindrosporum h7]
MQMPSQINLDAKERSKVKKALPSSSNTIHYAARARIYRAHAGTKKWSYAGIEGALVFSELLNAPSNTLHFQVVDLDGIGGVIWDYEIHDGFALDQEKNVTFFLSFEGDMGGEVRCRFISCFSFIHRSLEMYDWFVFEDDSEAKAFYNHVKNNKDIKPSRPKRSSWMKSISKGGGGNNIDKSMISHPKEGGFVHVAHMSYDADSGFTSKGVDPSWTTFLEGLHGYSGKEVAAADMDFIKDFIRMYSERQKQPVVADSRQRPPPPPPPRSRSHNGTSIPPPLSAQRPPVAHHRLPIPIVEDEISPPAPPPRRPTPPTRAPPTAPERPLPPQPGGPPLSREPEPNQGNSGINNSRPRYSKSPPSPLVLHHSNSRSRSTSSSITPSRSASSTVGASTLGQRQGSQITGPVDRLHEVVQEDEEELLTPEANQTVQLASQNSQSGIAPWILASRTSNAPKKSEDPQFMAHMTSLRRQTHDSDASSTGSAPRLSFMMETRISITSSAFSQSLSVPSPLLVVEFPPTPVFKDEIPEGIMQNVNSRPLYSPTSREFTDWV